MSDIAEINVPVLIVGGGGAGMTASICLSNAGVEHLLVERRRSTSALPKAHYLNQRTMEIFRQHGVADAIYPLSAPAANFGKVNWVTSLGGDGYFDRLTVAQAEAFGGGSLAAKYAPHSAAISTNLPQLRLEPVLREAAEQRNPGRVRFGHELTDWVEDAEGVLATVTTAADGQSYRVRARYVVAADGGRFIGGRLGVKMEGLTDIAKIVSAHFRADLSSYVEDDALIYWLVDPTGRNVLGKHAMVKMGPTWDRHSEEWAVHFALRPGDPDTFEETSVSARVKELLKIDVDIEILKLSHWRLDRIVADKWRVGRFFLAGDAVHRQPPTSGLGLNTAVHDAHNLAWKLAEVIHGRADESLLDHYEAERRPVSCLGADWALLALGNYALIEAALGVCAAAPEEANMMAFAALISDTPLGETLRARLAETAKLQRIEFEAHDVEMGYNYDGGAVVHDGTVRAPRDPLGSRYSPTSRPGSRLPHAWLLHGTERVSTHDLVGAAGGYLLLTGGAAEDWESAAKAASAAHGVDIQVVRVGDGGNYQDVDGDWAQRREVSERGALLVRPDNFVAWRAADAVADPTAELVGVLAQITGRQ
jgi:2,4-dichlorophenol 6-monooxygenase